MLACAVVNLAGTLLCILGVYCYTKDAPNERYRKESICQVERANRDKQIHTCKPFSREDTHYFPVWSMKHSGRELINATIQP